MGVPANGRYVTLVGGQSGARITNQPPKLPRDGSSGPLPRKGSLRLEWDRWMGERWIRPEESWGPRPTQENEGMFRTDKLWVPHISQSEMWVGCGTAVC